MNMRSFFFLRKLALVAGLAAHVMLPVATAAAPATFDVASLICAPSGQVSSEAKAALAEMLRLAGEDITGETDTAAAGHCGACVVSICAMTPNAQTALAIAFAHTNHGPAATRDNVHYAVHGPPLGLRAPPISLIAI